MKKFMINICYGSKVGRADGQEIMEKYEAWSHKMGARIVHAHKLKDGEGRKLTLKNNQVIDGPYTESKESIGGYYVVEAKDYDEACHLAKDCPTLLYQGGYVEVREVEF